jgi:hypothetical protein
MTLKEFFGRCLDVVREKVSQILAVILVMLVNVVPE